MSAERERKPRIIVCDNFSLYPTHCVPLLSMCGLDVIKVFSACEEFLEKYRKYPFDVVILDLGMAPNKMDGNELFYALRKEDPRIKIIINSIHTHQAIQDAYFKVGANGYLPKGIQSEWEILAEMVEKVIKGERCFYFYDVAKEIGYTPRQLEAIPYISKGLTIQQVADEMGVGYEAAKKRVKELHIITDTHTLSEMVNHFMKNGLAYLPFLRDFPRRPK
jgi:DNA-binding NarL/FixJ family response regulator